MFSATTSAYERLSGPTPSCRRRASSPLPHRGLAQPLAPGSEEEFITEHHWGYALRRGRPAEYAVEHPPWRVWQVADAWFVGDAGRLYGAAFAEALAAPPVSAFLAEGSAVTVRQGQRL